MIDSSSGRCPGRGEPIEFGLDGVVFHFTPPKLAPVAIPIDENDGDGTYALGTVMGWICEGLPPDEEALLHVRLTDPDDDFDVGDLMEIFSALFRETGRRPGMELEAWMAVGLDLRGSSDVAG